MFVWNKDKKILLLPASLYEKDNNWRTLDYYNGLLSVSIDKDAGIQLKNKATHIDLSGVEEERKLECSKYTSNDKPSCRELLNGELYCEDENEYNGYVPNYCFADSTVWSYVGDKSWEYSAENIKRALYIGDNVYGISDTQISSYDWSLNQQKTLRFD